MAITKKIEIDGKEVLFRASAAIPRLYRIKFRRDIYKDLAQLEKAVDQNVEEGSMLDTFSLELFENIAYMRGVKDLDVSLEKQSIKVVYDPAKTSKAILAREIEKIGYEADEHDHENEKIKQAYELCKNLSRNDLVTVEEYITMPSLTVIEGDIFVNNGEIMWDGLFLTRRSPSA